MKRAVRGLRTALGTLTVLPAGRFEPDPGAAVPWFPWVGWLFGAVALAMCVAARWAGLASGLEALLVAAAVVSSWAALSRFLHWDGLADTIDGAFGGKDPAERLVIMQDSRIGAFGAFAVVAMFALKTVAVALVYASGAWLALVLAPVAGRLAATFGVYVLKPARSCGLGASLKRDLPQGGWLFAAMALGPALALGSFEWRDLALLAVAFGSAAAVHFAHARPFGGFTGDTLGASILGTETTVLLAAAVLLSLA